MNTEDTIRHDFETARESLNERTLRAFVAEKALAVGYGGVTMVHRATGVARSTIKRGLQEMRAVDQDPQSVLLPGRIRRAGGGRAPLTARYPGLNDAIEAVLEPSDYSDRPYPPLKWTLDSTRNISARLKQAGLDVSPSTARKQLKVLGYTLQTTDRHLLGANQHPYGNAQHAHINARVTLELSRNNPVLSIESRKLCKDESPSFERCSVREYPDSQGLAGLSRGIYGFGPNRSGYDIPTDRADSEFACHSVHGWWKAEGKRLFPNANLIYMTAGRGGCSFTSLNLFHVSVFELASKIRLPVAVSHFQPGTSRWDPALVHRLFSFFSTGWGGIDSGDCETTVSLISDSSVPMAPLDRLCRLNHLSSFGERDWVPVEMALDHTQPGEFQSEWNYTVLPLRKPEEGDPGPKRRVRGPSPTLRFFEPSRADGDE
ncbi:MAG: ISAzo13 family transposase [Deltaproteobacteria bacterium]|jgi:hypothetical protein|nr:ISAzo13 family transposase [Deltaproteobacteria bacterium]